MKSGKPVPEADLDLLRLDRQVCFPLYAASNLITRLYHPVLSRLGLTYPQYLVLLVLWEQSPQSVGNFSELLHLDNGTVTPLLKRMEAAGLVTRQRDPQDERRVLVSLTEAGDALRHEAQQVPLTLGKGLHMSSAEIETLRDAVQNLVRILARREQSGGGG
ncbi:MarR family transcriptional regulator [Caballeronia sp. AZ7_KS35]|uniref:MarR family winged helix-turn-helix transcriptional regulator n=1 Tax=Caballeronia sp. AZ7_KS35 TaxID=2921762 RepID=UPI0020282B93|nr:MarR family transcriptional regulator [Caballeronia sp. AZ7_KS35]